MTTIYRILYNFLDQAFARVASELLSDKHYPVNLNRANDSKFGDFQVNGVMPMAKSLSQKPYDLALKIVALLRANLEFMHIVSDIVVAHPGFINITLSNSYLASYLSNLNHENRFGIDIHSNHQITIVDYSSPNLAKQMHVGHLRSTIIGDAIARILEYSGDQVILQNHIGDWGTAFGMIIAYLINNSGCDIDNINSSIDINKILPDDLQDIEDIYLKAKVLFDQNETFACLARRCVVILQTKSNDLQPEDAARWQFIHNCWERLTFLSFKHCQDIYRRLGVKLNENDTRSESFYNDMLPTIVNDLLESKAAIFSNGAVCVFLENSDSPFVIRKQDGGYLYATTDLAAIKYRASTLKAKRIVYVVDNRQSLHFKQLFAIAFASKLVNSDTTLEHIGFGTMMNQDGKPFKTRTGGAFKLFELLDEAYSRALNIVNERHGDTWDIEHKITLASKLSIAAIKYADLSKNRNTDYIFNLDSMLSFDGNTALYLLYAYTRINSIFAKANSRFVVQEFDWAALRQHASDIEFSAIEHNLMLALATFNYTIKQVYDSCCPHYLCQYLYELVVIFMQFYESCPILNAKLKHVVDFRLTLVRITSEILKTGLGLLGIDTVERM